MHAQIALGIWQTSLKKKSLWASTPDSCAQELYAQDMLKLSCLILQSTDKPEFRKQ